MAVVFKQGTTGDIEVFLPLVRAYYAYDRHEYDEAKVRQALVALLGNPVYGRAWLMVDAEKPMGYMVACFGFSLEFGGRDAFLDEIFIEEAYRGQGVGQLALQHMADACRIEGIMALHLEVMPGNQQVIAFYERAGFVNRGSSLMSHTLTELG